MSARILTISAVILASVCAGCATQTASSGLADKFPTCFNLGTPDTKAEACTYILQTQTLNPIDRAHILVARGAASAALAEDQKAIDDYTQALALDPKLDAAYYGRGNAYSNLKKYDEAIADYDAALGINPRYSWAYNNRGIIYKHRRQFAMAISDFTKAIDSDPRNRTAVLNRALSYKSISDFRRSIDDFEQFMALKRFDSFGPAWMAWMFATCPDERFRDGKRAVSLGNRAVQLDERSGFAHDALAAAFAESGRWQEAVSEAQQALNIWQQSAADSRVVEGAKERLALYQHNQPYRDPPEDVPYSQ